MSVASTGVVTGATFNGIQAVNNGTDISISATEVSGGGSGINALNTGTGVLSITSTGAVIGETSTGIIASSSGTDLTLQVADVTGAMNGILAFNTGTGALSIAAEGDVKATTITGISATTSGTDLTIDVVNVISGYVGIVADNTGTGVLSITSTGAVTGTTGSGIISSSTGTDLILQVTDVTAGVMGIVAANSGSGAVSITSTGDVTGINAAGIYAMTSGTDLTIDAVAVTGGLAGIVAVNTGTGDLSIAATGDVTGTADNGIDATNAGTDLTIDAVNVTGGLKGISAINTGTGALSITSTGDVTGTADNGINATTAGTDLTIDTLNVTGGVTGIVAANSGSGALSITSTGSVTGSTSNGITASNTTSGTDLTLQVADVTGVIVGIQAHNYGSGALNITSTGAVTGSSNFGIFGTNSLSANDLTIMAADVSGGLVGILADNTGTGDLSIAATGDVTGTADHGIDATNAGTDLTIDAVAVTGGLKGISAVNTGTGALSITSTGDVTGTADNGIDAVTAGADLTIDALDVTGGLAGIVADSTGTGALSITSTGAVIGETSTGIDASSIGTALTIQVADVNGVTSGINAINGGSGALSITSSGTVTGTADDGIHAATAGTSLRINTANVTGGVKGISALNSGTGVLRIDSSGLVTGLGGAGIIAHNLNSAATAMRLNVNSVSGSTRGIEVAQQGTGELNINISGLVQGGSDAGLVIADMAAGTVGTIINSGTLTSAQLGGVRFTDLALFAGDFNNQGDITAGLSGIAFDASPTTHGIVLNQINGTISGDVLLGTGDDLFTFSGGVIDGDIIGQSVGTVNINAGAGNILTLNGVTNVEDFNIVSGTLNQLGDFSTAGNTTTIASGATLSFSTPIAGSGAFISSGNVQFLGDEATGGLLTQAGTVTLESGSTIDVPLFIATADESDVRIIMNTTSFVDNGAIVIEDSLWYNFELLADNGVVSVTVSTEDLSTLSTDPNISAFGAAQTAFFGNGGQGAVIDYLSLLPDYDVDDFEQAAGIFSPSVSGAVVQGALLVNDASSRLITQRFANDTNGEQFNGLWLQAFGGTAEQDGTDSVLGFDANTDGVALGYDRDLGQWRAGVALSRGETEVDNDRFANDQIEIQSTDITLYGGYKLDQWFASASLSVASLDYDFKRTSLVPGESGIKANTSGDLLRLAVAAGMHYTEINGVALAPVVSLLYTSLGVDGFTEIGGANMQINYADNATLTSELGINASKLLVTNEWTITPSASLAWSHEYLEESEQAMVKFADQSFEQNGFERNQDQVKLGLAVEAINSEGVIVGASYRASMGSDFTSNQGSVTVRYEF